MQVYIEQPGGVDLKALKAKGVVLKVCVCVCVVLKFVVCVCVCVSV